MKFYTCKLVRDDAKTLCDVASNGDVHIPGCTEMSCLALFVTSQLVGTSRVYGVPECEQVETVMAALKLFGVKIFREDACCVVSGVGVGGFAETSREVEIGGMSPASVGAMLGLAATQPFSTYLVAGLQSGIDTDTEDIADVMKMLSAVGAGFVDYKIPTVVKGSDECVPFLLQEPTSLLSVKIASLMASLNIAGYNQICSYSHLNDYVEWLLTYVGSEISCRPRGNADIITHVGHSRELSAKCVKIPPSQSMLIYAIVALLFTSADVNFSQVLLGRTCRTCLEIFVRMGGKILFSRGDDGEFYDVGVKSSELQGIDISYEELRYAAGELPLLCVVAAMAEGTTRITCLTGMTDEHKKLLNMVEQKLQACSVTTYRNDDSFIICGGCGIRGDIVLDCPAYQSVAIPFMILGLATGQRVLVRQDCCQMVMDFIDVLSRARVEIGLFE